MTIDEILDGFTCLDADLLDEYLTQKAANRQRLARRQVMHKRMLTCAACFMLVAAVTLSAVYHVQYPAIPLENAVGDVSARYVPECMVVGENDFAVINYTDSKLFNWAEYIFSGTVENIEYIKIDFDGHIVYSSITTIIVENYYKGNGKTKLKVYSIPTKSESLNDPSLFDMIQIGTYGIFITGNLPNNNTITYNHGTLHISDIADTVFFDNLSCAFIKDNMTNQAFCYDNIYFPKDNFFSTLNDYDWESVIEYIENICT